MGKMETETIGYLQRIEVLGEQGSADDEYEEPDGDDYKRKTHSLG